MSNRTHHAVRNMAIFILERACVHLVERDYNNGRVPDGAVNDAISIMLHSARGRVEIALFDAIVLTS